MQTVLWTYAPILIGTFIALALDAFALRRSAIASAAAGLLVGALGSGMWAMTQSSGVWGALREGGAYSLVGAIIAGLAGLAVLGGWDDLAENRWGGTLAGLIAFGAAASIAVAQSKDLIFLLISLETAASCGYALVALGGRSGSREAAMKYFIQGAIITGFLIFGIAVLVTLFLPRGDIDALQSSLAGVDTLRVTALAGVALVLGALAFKSGAVPFHSWVPDAYENAMPNASAFLASGPKFGAITAFAVISSLAATSGEKVSVAVTAVVIVLAVLSILIGSVTALRQRSYTRMLAYAGIAQVGYALVAAAANRAPMVTVFFIAMYAVASTGTFLAASAFKRVRPEWDGSVEGLAGLGRQAPLLGVTTSLLMISLAGIPPLVGFWSKFTVFYSAAFNGLTAFFSGAQVEGWFILVGAVAGIVGSAISLAYYGGVLRSLYAPLPESAGEGTSSAENHPSSWSAVAVVVALAVVVVAAGAIPIFAGIDALVRIFA